MTTSKLGIALVTGASNGIGAVYADRLAQRGYDLVLVARDAQRLSKVANRIIQSTGRQVEVVPADLADRAGLAKVEARLRTDAGITMLVNNAGFGSTKSVLDSDIDQLDAMIDLNVTVLTRLAHAAASNFAAHKRGAIINIASIAALSPEILNGTYSGTKAYVLAFSQSLKSELADKGVQVQAVLPGATATNFWNVAGTPVDYLPKEIVMPTEEMVDASLAGFDMGELVTIPALPDVADWLTFDAARKALGPNLSRSTAAARYKA